MAMVPYSGKRTVAACSAGAQDDSEQPKTGSVKGQRAASAVLSMANRSALKEINEILKRQPEKIFPCLQSCKGNLFLQGNVKTTQRGRQLDVAEPWPDTYQTVSFLPTAWLCAFLQKVQPAFTADLLAKVHAFEISQVKKLIVFGCGLRDGSCLPPECRCKMICSMWFHRLYELMGSRFTESWVETCIDENTGEVNWQMGGCFTLQKNDQGKWIICHIQGESGLAKVDLDDLGTVVEMNWDDMSSTFGGELELKSRRALPDKGVAIERVCEAKAQKALAKSIAGKRKAAQAEGSHMAVVVSTGAVQAADVRAQAATKRRKAPPSGPAPRMILDAE